ncbi:hypothetical protein LSUE1_G010080 [Lachnellula suecica]|uniref:Geranylgeranyl pyrophosphate synthetase n=1 Tax=Lachnellula suecica TaxID=602035 RepID=A0A8T9BVC2_9HELO|nr:hypothetical protein LSUE1_G010080 [Lachnellula suecica]
MASIPASEIFRHELHDISAISAYISNVQHLASYNWIEAPTPTIAVPGCPSLWSIPKVSRRLPKDSGFIYIAQNAARHPESPLEPLFRALFVENPSFDIGSIDLVSDRNNIRKLLSFINPKSSRNGLETFTIKIEVTKDTAIFCRMATAVSEIVGPREFKGFGYEFEKAYTTSQISGSTGHHRIISYRFADLNIIVRHETDGYVKVEGDAPTSSKILKDHENDNLSDLLDSLALSPIDLEVKSTSALSRLTVKKEGKVVPLESILEIKTRVAHRPLSMQETVAQLWASQTPKLVRAYHNNGMFQRPKVEDVTVEIREWEEQNQTHLKKLTVLIKTIISAVKECGGKATLKYDEKGDKLVVWKLVDEKPMLPNNLYFKWEDKKKSDEVLVGSSGALLEITNTSEGDNATAAKGKLASTSPSQISGQIAS